MIYSWQQTQWQQLTQRLRDNTLPHALLLAGAPGLGKLEFAKHFAAFCLCEQPDMAGDNCGQCRSCNYMQADSHPDFIHIQPEKEGAQIKVDMIRQLILKNATTSHTSKHKVIIIEPAEAMNRAASNAVLKTLEEPTPGTIILLVCHQPSSLLSTIRSRCQLMHFQCQQQSLAIDFLVQQGIAAEQAQLFLSLSEQSPLRARELADNDGVETRRQFLSSLSQISRQQIDPVSVAQQCNVDELMSYLQWLMSWINDIIRVNAGLPAGYLCNQDLIKPLQAQNSAKYLHKLFAYLQYLYTIKSQLLAKLNPNKQLLIEDLLIRWAGITHE